MCTRLFDPTNFSSGSEAVCGAGAGDGVLARLRRLARLFPMFCFAGSLGGRE